MEKFITLQIEGVDRLQALIHLLRANSFEEPECDGHPGLPYDNLDLAYQDIKRSLETNNLTIINETGKVISTDSAQMQNDEVKSIDLPLPENYVEAVRAVIRELKMSLYLYPDKIKSAHEGYAIIKEEVDELWEEVKSVGYNEENPKMLEEAKQVGAMGTRFLAEINQ